jgi:hypothetical protein
VVNDQSFGDTANRARCALRGHELLALGASQLQLVEADIGQTSPAVLASPRRSAGCPHAQRGNAVNFPLLIRHAASGSHVFMVSGRGKEMKEDKDSYAPLESEPSRAAS